MTAPLVETVGGSGAIRFRVDLTDVQAVMSGMPKVGYFWLRDFLGRSFGQHRVQWLRSKGTAFGRGDDKSKAIKVSQVNAGGTGKALQPNEVRYSVSPAEKRMATAAAARAGLQALEAAVETDNSILPVHQFGTDIRSTRPMFVPVRTRPGNFKKWRAQHPGAKLRFLPSKRDDKTLVYEATRRRAGRGRPRKDAPPAAEKLRLRWILTKQVAMKRTLRLYESWEGMQSVRDRLFKEAADKMQRDLERLDPRDL